MSYAKLLGALVCVLAAGCTAKAVEPDAQSGGEATTTATIAFDEGFAESVTGRLAPGRSVRVDYDVDRLTTCRGEQGGIPQWTITGFWRIDGGPIRMFPAGGLGLAGQSGSPTITLDASGDLEIWFQNTSRWGCNAYDSAYGQNYHFAVP